MGPTMTRAANKLATRRAWDSGGEATERGCDDGRLVGWLPPGTEVVRGGTDN